MSTTPPLGTLPEQSAGLAIAAVEDALANSRPRVLDIPGYRHAAVLVPLLDAGDGLELLLTVRATTLRSHAGQIALPGGRLEPGEDFIEAAIRETAEEVGLVVDRADVLGELSDHPSPAGFVARPVVARVTWPQAMTLDPREVAEAFTVPFDELRSVVPSSQLVTMNQYRRRIFSYRWGQRNIWGFTGNVIRNLFDVIDGRDDDPFGS